MTRKKHTVEHTLIYRACTPQIYTCDTSLWFSLSQACLMVVLWSKRWARSSNFSWRISSLRNATPLSCSAFSSLSHACSDNKTMENQLVPDDQTSALASNTDVHNMRHIWQSWWMYDLVDVRDKLSIMRHIGFLVVGSEFALDGKEKDFKIPFLLKSVREAVLS